MNQLASRGQWAKARQVVSPNQDARPEQEVSLLLLHAISLPPGQFSGHAIEALFTNRLVPDAHPFFATIAYLRVSAHLLIRRDGECVQFVDVDQLIESQEGRTIPEIFLQQGEEFFRSREQEMTLTALDDTVETPGLVLMISNDGRMVCAVLCAAPETIPSARPVWTIIVPK